MLLFLNKRSIQCTWVNAEVEECRHSRASGVTGAYCVLRQSWSRPPNFPEIMRCKGESKLCVEQLRQRHHISSPPTPSANQLTFGLLYSCKKIHCSKMTGRKKSMTRLCALFDHEHSIFQFSVPASDIITAQSASLRLVPKRIGIFYFKFEYKITKKYKIELFKTLALVIFK